MQLRHIIIYCRAVTAGLLFAVISVATAAGASDSCPQRPTEMDERYCDANGDLVADTPRHADEWLNPTPLVFSYTPIGDPSVYKRVFSEFMQHLARATGRTVKWYGADSYAAQVEAMRSGRLHIAGISTGPTVFAVNLAGYVPIAIMAKNGDQFGYRLQLITHPDSGILSVRDLKGRKVAHVSLTSNSGNQAPRALFRSMGVTPDIDYTVIYSGTHDHSIQGVARREYDAAPVASSVLDRMIDKGAVDKGALRVVWQSRLFPTTSYGYAHNLHPALQKRIRDAFLGFDWRGTGLEKEFGAQSDRFIPINYREHWADIRTIQQTNGVAYTMPALDRLKVRNEKKP